MNELTGFQRDLLRMVASMDEPNGLDIKERIAEERPEKIHHSRLYTNLDKLARKGLVHKDAVDDRSNEYRVSSRGKREVLMAQRAWNDAAMGVDSGVMQERKHTKRTSNG